MANIMSEKAWTEMVNKVREMELKLQQKENDVNDVMERHAADINHIKYAFMGSDGQIKLQPKHKPQDEVFTWEIPQMGAAATTVNVTSPVYSLQAFPIGFKVMLLREASSQPLDIQPINALQRHRFGNMAAAKVVQTPQKELSVALALTESEDAFNKLPFYPTVTYTVCDVTGNEYLQDITRTVEQPFGTQIEYDRFSYNATLDWALLQSPKYLSHGDQLTVKIGVSFDSPKCTENIVRWKVSHYWMKRFMYRKGFINYHPVNCIETHSRGYRVRIKQHFGDTFAISVQFLTSEFDDQLKEVFAHVTTVVVENQWDPSPKNDLVKTFIQKDSMTEYQLDIATHNELEAGGYLVDDTLKLKFIMSAI